MRVRARAVGSNIEVKISDTGMGIPPEQLKKIHEPFYTTKATGFGLGLAICRSILWDAGGEMNIDSCPGKGTIVTVLLPIHVKTTGAREAARGASRGRSAPARPPVGEPS